MTCDVLLALEWYDHRIHHGVASVAAQYGWQLVYEPSQGAANPTPRGWHGDGIIALINTRAHWRRIRSTKLPVVDLGLSIDVPVARVVTDNRAIAALAAEHFLSRGFRHFASIAPGQGRMLDERRDAFAALIEAQGFHCHQIDLLGHSRRNAWRERQAALRKQLLKLPKPCAVFCAQDTGGAEIIYAADQESLRVPQDLAVIGVDNNELTCEALRIPLSSVDSNQFELGRRAAERLQALMHGRDAEPLATQLIPPRGLIERRSSDSYATNNPLIVEAFSYMRQHLASGLSLAQVAQHVACSAQGLDKAFQRELARNPGSILRELRLERAKTLLATTEQGLEQIAQASGLSSASSLCAVFRRALGCTPDAWRSEHFRNKQVESDA